MTRELVFTPLALADLDHIFWYTAADNPRRAESYIDDIVERCRALCETPMIGVDRSHIRPGLRILPLWRRVIVVYELPDTRVDVLRVFSRGRDVEGLLRTD